MRRHVLIGRYGRGDRSKIPMASDEVVTRLELVSTQRILRHGIGEALVELARLGVFPTEIGIDLLTLAALVHAADTRISRETESQDTWTREIRLVVPVSDLRRWSSTSTILERLLNFLTGDRWTIGFRQRPKAFLSLATKRPRNGSVPPFDTISLFSGGLDSLIGAIDFLEGGSTPLLISHAGDGATSDAQHSCFEDLNASYDQPFGRLRVWMSIPKSLVSGVKPETTTRGRSFLFFAIGIFAGTGLPGSFPLLVPENGFISLNVPLDPLRLGSNSTRTTHPFYISLWNDLLAALGIERRLENPYWDRTKGEMISECANPALLRRLIPSSMSCSSPTKSRWRGRGVEHCGYCIPCLVRRAGLAHALGVAHDPTIYTIPDLTARPLPTAKAEGKQIRAFQVSMKRLHDRPEVAPLLIHKPGPLPDHTPEHRRALADVFLRGMNEVATVLRDVRTRAE